MLDITSLWAFLHRHKNHAGPLIIGLLLFAAGWQLGRVMSPYYAAHPIVFEERICTDCASSGGSREELTDLQAQGKEAQNKDRAAVPQSDSDATQTPPAVAGSTTTERTDGRPVTQQNKFVGSVNSDLYHHPDCSSANRIKPENQIWFSSIDDATAAGYSPSKCTRGKLGL